MSRSVSVRLLLFTVVALATAVAPQGAAASPFAKGPDPTPSTLASTVGPYAVARAGVPDSAAAGFGPGAVWYPAGTTGETFGGVAISPGFLADGTTLTWLARRLASQGFVVLVFSTNSIVDQPDSRGRQLRAALTFLTARSTVRALVDPSRLAVVGHSMGGGGALEAARRDHTLKAAVAIFPWDLQKRFSAITTPTLVIGSRPDWIAPAAQHARPFYASLLPTLPRAYLELEVDHAAPILPVTEISRATTNWLKRFVDDDERYTGTLCASVAGVNPATVTAYRSSCGEGPLG